MLINLWDTFGNFVEKYQLKVYRIISMFDLNIN